MMKFNYIFSIFICFVLCSKANAQCADTPHAPFEKDSWRSCEQTANPNPDRPVSHWIMYDLGFEYPLDSTYIWNYNAWGENDMGIRQAAIDYSSDGTNWSQLGTFEIEQASGSFKYEGLPGPSFNNTPARYVLITALSNWGDASCTGLSEIKFSIGEITSIDPDPERVDYLLNISPNPVVDFANVSIKGNELPSQVALFDLSGKMLEQTKDLQSMNAQFDLKGLSAGIYFVKVWVGEDILSEKVVKIE